MANANSLEPLFVGLTNSTSDELTIITGKLVDKIVSLDEWFDFIAELLSKNHITAAHYGRGALSVNATDLKIADLFSVEQIGFLENFKLDLESKDPRYISSDLNYILDSILYRIQLYPSNLRVTSIRSFLENISNDEEIYWKLTAFEHCKDCPYVAQGSPYTKSTLYLLPGDGTTECKMNCKCILETKSGTRCFKPV